MKKKNIVAIFLIVCTLILVGWVAVVSAKQSERNKRIQEEVATLEEEAEKIRRENATLMEKMHYFASTDFREQEAKKKLGLKKQEETVVTLRPVPEYATESTVDASTTSRMYSTENSPVREIPNYEKWLKLFL
ncbi:MAG: FtsB family cell division protein [Minisyncoccota bacterium]